MRVQRVLMPDGTESWTVLDGEHGVVQPVESFLAHLSAVERSPNTVRAYAQDLRDFFAYLQRRGLDWRQVRLEDLGSYVAWLRLPPGARDGQVVALLTAGHHCSAATVNRKLSALSSFYLFHERHGVERSASSSRPGGGRWATPAPGSRCWPIWARRRGPAAARSRFMLSDAPPQELTAAQVEALLAACKHLRDRLLLTLLRRTGLRIGEALGLRHEDIHSADGQLVVRQRVNANRARASLPSPTLALAQPALVTP